MLFVVLVVVLAENLHNGTQQNINRRQRGADGISVRDFPRSAKRCHEHRDRCSDERNQFQNIVCSVSHLVSFPIP